MRFGLPWDRLYFRGAWEGSQNWNNPPLPALASTSLFFIIRIAHGGFYFYLLALLVDIEQVLYVCLLSE